jgi:hypothetical protein
VKETTARQKREEKNLYVQLLPHFKREFFKIVHAYLLLYGESNIILAL